MFKVFKKTTYLLIFSICTLLLSLTYASTGNIKSDKKFTSFTYSENETELSSSFSVMTYNIGYLSGMTNNLPVTRKINFFRNHLIKCKDMIKNTYPHIIGFQEIDFDSNRSFNINQLDALATDYKAAYQSINWDKKYVPFPYWPPSRHFGKMLSGQAILSQLTIQNSHTIELIKPLNRPFYYNAFYLDRLLQIADIQIGSKMVKVMNVHLEAFDTQTRLKQMKIVKATFEKYANTQPVVLMGDFNSECFNQEMNQTAIQDLMHSNWIESAISFDKESENRTFPSSNPEIMIDYIFFNSNFLVCDSARIITEAGEISDHLPVWASLKLK